MNKLEKFGEIWELHKLIVRLADECIAAILEAKQDLTEETLLKAYLKTQEYHLCCAEFKERLDQWQTN